MKVLVYCPKLYKRELTRHIGNAQQLSMNFLLLSKSKKVKTGRWKVTEAVASLSGLRAGFSRWFWHS